MSEKYCTECGSALTKRVLKNEGIIPFCQTCGEYRFPKFNAAVSMIVIDEKNKKILLIKQYGRPNYVLVAGYINRTECAEHAAEREISDETGLCVSSLVFNRSSFYERTNTLMFNFTAFISDASKLHTNSEIDSCCWFTFEEARENISHGSLAEQFLTSYLDSIK